jgi:regulator of protease activity HflC (stomatin/prohibitin superfamily)
MPTIVLQLPTSCFDPLIASIPLLLVLFILVWLGSRSARIVRPTQRGLVERYGRYHRFVESGLTFLIPVVDR